MGLGMDVAGVGRVQLQKNWPVQDTTCSQPGPEFTVGETLQSVTRALCLI